jgi:hypothetical protein
VTVKIGEEACERRRGCGNLHDQATCSAGARIEREEHHVSDGRDAKEPDENGAEDPATEIHEALATEVHGALIHGALATDVEEDPASLRVEDPVTDRATGLPTDLAANLATDRPGAAKDPLEDLRDVAPDRINGVHLTPTETEAFNALARACELVGRNVLRRFRGIDQDKALGNVLLTFVQKYDTDVKQASRLRAWIRTIARNEGINEIRRIQKTADLPDGRDIPVNDTWTDGNWPAWERASLARKCRSALAARLAADPVCPFHLRHGSCDHFRWMGPRIKAFLRLFETGEDAAVEWADWRDDLAEQIAATGLSKRQIGYREIPCFDWWSHVSMSEPFFPTADFEHAAERPDEEPVQFPRTREQRQKLPAEDSRKLRRVLVRIGPWRYWILSRLRLTTDGSWDKANGCPPAAALRIYAEQDLHEIIDRHLAAVVPFFMKESH